MISDLRQDYGLDVSAGGAHGLILSRVPPGSDVLDVGCASGYLGSILTRRGCRVWGIEGDAARIAMIPPNSYVDVACRDLDDLDVLPWPDARFDVVIAGDVLEHLRSPERTLATLVRCVQPGGLILMSLPNVAHVAVRAELLVGRFEYRRSGILDRTHLRFFTFSTAERFVRSQGLIVHEILAASDRFAPLLRRPVLGRLLRGLLGFNIVIVASRRRDGAA